ncbi:thiamine phosphate synthase [Croceibacterium sp. TMG7-5b_MA50]|uniref:thiamine phosphate synthase n=1 Tax=Croceibacterium sp. TMG7-5b_MA50 TaxID=3121290 RepID=UPI003221838C
MPSRQTLTALPALWLLTDARNDAALDRALARLPRGSAVIFRHYHLPVAERRARFAVLRRQGRARGLLVVLAGKEHWPADMQYGRRIAGRPWLATVHSAREIARANLAGADALVLSPVFPTRSHPGAATLGPVRFRLLARLASAPVIALGGMDAAGARRLRWLRWAAIDGLSRA